VTIDFTKLLDRINPEPDGEDFLKLRTGVVSSVNANGTLDVTISGLTIPNLPKLAGVSVPVNAVVQILSLRGSLLVIGAVSGSAGDSGFIDEVRFTSSDTFFKDDYPTATRARVRVQAGGGGGGGAFATGASQHACGGGGGGGGYAESWLDISGLAASVTVTVGPGGGGGVGGVQGTNGSPSSFGALVATSGGLGGSVPGGATGVVFGVTGGGGGSASAGDLQFGGTAGGYGFGSLALCHGGVGGASHLGGGGNGVGSGAAPNSGGGGAGRIYGGGGAGAFSNGTAASATGGSGAQGIVIVELYA
jgi:hypothetical protein